MHKPMLIDLSVVFGTYNRLPALKQCLEALRLSVFPLGLREIIIVDGGSTDGTLEFLRDRPRVKLIEHGELRGPVAAYNDGFKAAQGDFVAYLNDDLILRPGQLSSAVDLLKKDCMAGIVSLQYVNEHEQSIPIPPRCTVGQLGKIPFASFGVLWRSLGEAVGWFDGFYHYYGDCHLCVQIQMLGYKLVTLTGFTALHLNMDNAVRGNAWEAEDARGRAREDGRKWAEMWKQELEV